MPRKSELDHEDSETRDQYISVLLEFYSTKAELDRPSPLERAKLSHWRRVVAAFEYTLPGNVRNKIRYRARKAEARRLSPIHVALVRYAWNAYYVTGETEPAVTRRWESYLLDSPSEAEGNTVGYEVFRIKRKVQQLVKQLLEEGLWPWVS